MNPHVKNVQPTTVMIDGKKYPTFKGERNKQPMIWLPTKKRWFPWIEKIMGKLPNSFN